VRRKSLKGTDCAVALALEHVGDWWNILILRDALQGYSRFDDFHQSLEISPTMLTRKLNALVDSGLLEKRQYLARPPRFEYVLTPLGKDFGPVLVALFAWGKRNFQSIDRGIVLVDSETNEFAEPIVSDRKSGEIIRSPRFSFKAAKGSSAATKRRLSRSR